MLVETGCAGVSIGRGAFYDPWIFRRTDHYLRTGELLPEPNFAERVRVMRRHFERYCEFYGEEHGAGSSARSPRGMRNASVPAKPFKQRIIAITLARRFRGRRRGVPRVARAVLRRPG
jgi:tRNA-dihydrouridine synthase B